MATLPKITYSTNVASLGREDIGQPGREAAAEIGAINTAVQGVVDFEKTVAAAQYTKQMSTARNSINELYDTIISKDAFI